MTPLKYEQMVKKQEPIFESPLSAVMKVQDEQNILDKKTVEIKTICRDCVFAEFTDDYTEQVGCVLGRLEKFKAKGLVKDLVDEETDVKYHEIQRLCNTCRNSDWASKYDDIIEKVKKENEIQLDFIMKIDTTDIAWTVKAVTTFTTLVDQTLKPKKIFLVFDNVIVDTKDLKAVLDHLVQGTGVLYEFLNVIDGRDLVDAAVNRSRSQYYTLCDVGSYFQEDFVAKLEKLLNEDMTQFSLIEPQEGMNGLTVQRLLHSIVGGNHYKPVSEKIKELAKNQNVMHMVRKFEDI